MGVRRICERCNIVPRERRFPLAFYGGGGGGVANWIVRFLIG